MADRENVINELNECIEHIRKNEFDKIPFWGNCQSAMMDALELLKSKPDIDKIVKELDDTSKQYEPRPFESINWMLRYEGIRIGLEIAQYVVKGEPIPDEF